jgi:16S rRNA (guanine527-N7)-methyltransferase
LSSSSLGTLKSERRALSADLLDRWLGGVLSTPGLTSLRNAHEARRVLLDDALRAVPLLRDLVGHAVDVGSGGGSPGIPLALALPGVHVTLLEAERRKCDFLERFAIELPNADVVWGRAELQPIDSLDAAFAKALARPPVAAELVLPLVRPGGVALIWVGRSAEIEPIAIAAAALGAEVEEAPEGLVLLRKVGATPPGFPRKPGIAKKRPLA